MLTAESIDRIVRFDGEGLPVLSMYVAVPVEPSDQNTILTRVRSLLHRIRPVTEDGSLDRRARMSLRSDIERVEHAAAEQAWQPGSVALFACGGRALFEDIPLPRATHDRVVVDQTPWVRPMLAVLDEYHRCCVVLIDRGRAQVWELYQDDMRAVATVQGTALRKSNYAAWFAEHRVRNRAEELSKRHVRNVANLLDELFRTHGYELLVLGGHEHEIPVFGDLLPPALRSRLAGSFTVDPHTASPADIRRHADAVVARHERDQERRLVAGVFDSAARGGPAALGLRACLWAGSVAAVDTLLVQEGAMAPGVVCDRDRWLAADGDVCGMCGGPTRRTPDVVDELVEAVIDESGCITHVQADDTPLREHAVAASLRFPLPAQP